MKKAAKITLIAHLFGVVLVSLFVFLVIYTQQNGTYRLGDCWFRDLTGFYCPGCGGTRGVFYLLKGQLVQSFVCYPVLLVSCLCIAYWDAVLILALMQRKQKILSYFSHKVWLAIPVVLLLQFILRNILFLTLGYDPLGNTNGTVPVLFETILI